MATKTISIEIDVYEKLKKAKTSPSESFSQVLRRAKWESSSITGAELLDLAKKRKKLISSKTLDTLDKNQKKDKPPESKWA